MGTRHLLSSAAAPRLAAILLLLPAASAAGQDTTDIAGRELAPLIDMRAAPGLEPIAAALMEDPAVTAPLPGIGSLEDVFPEPPVVWVVRDLSRVPGRPPGETPADWVAGFADADANMAAIRVGEDDRAELGRLRQVLRHELAHLALERATDGGAPRWLHEGYAQYVAGGWNWQEAWRLRFVLFRRGGGILHDLTLHFPERESEARLAYLLSYTAVQELATLSGPAGLRAYIRTLGEGATPEEAFRDVFGITMDQFEEEWSSSVQGRYGWLYFLSRTAVFWLVLTVALLVLGWRRRRYDKRRLEEMKRQDELEETDWRVYLEPADAWKEDYDE